MELKNLKGEIVKDHSDEEKWWKLSPSTLLLFAGLILFNLGCFLDPHLIDRCIRFFDVRFWPWWYFLFPLLAAGSFFQFYRIKRDWSDYFDYEKKRAKQFICLSVTLLLILMFFVVLFESGKVNVFFRPVGAWFGYGYFTFAALIRCALLTAGIVPLIYFAKEWILGFWEE